MKAYIFASITTLLLNAGAALADCPDAPVCRKATERLLELQSKYDAAREAVRNFKTTCKDSESDSACKRRLAKEAEKVIGKLEWCAGALDAGKQNFREACCLLTEA